MAIDASIFGRLSEFDPLNETEKQGIWKQMRSSADRSAFKRIEGSSKAIRDSVHVIGDGQEAQAVGEFATEFADRLEARDLRALAKRIKDRSQQRILKRSR